MLTFIDSHAHLGSDGIYPKIDEILARAKSSGIEAIVNICTCPDTLQKGIEIRSKYPWVYNTAATTPHDVEKEGEAVFSEIAKCARDGFLSAIGETGLDYYYEHSSPDIQKHFLRRYLQLALECKLPVVIHCREAFNNLFQILDEEYVVNGKHSPGVLHCFTGTVQEAEQVVQRGWFVSFSGIVTFKKSEQLREAAKVVPLKQLLVETDSPYLAPQSKRGHLNEPSFLPETAAMIAAVKGLSIEEVAKATSQNAMNLFSIKI